MPPPLVSRLLKATLHTPVHKSVRTKEFPVYAFVFLRKLVTTV